MAKKINENTLTQIVRDVINEAYGTPSSKDSEYYEELTDLDYSKEILPTILRTLKDMYNEISDYMSEVGNYNGDNDFQQAVKHIRSAILYTERVIKNEKMNMGQQPDVNYDSRHSAENWKKNGLSGYRPTHKSPGSPWPHSENY